MVHKVSESVLRIRRSIDITAGLRKGNLKILAIQK